MSDELPPARVSKHKRHRKRKPRAVDGLMAARQRMIDPADPTRPIQVRPYSRDGVEWSAVPENLVPQLPNWGVLPFDSLDTPDK